MPEETDDVRATAGQYFAKYAGRAVPLDLLLGYLSVHHEHGEDELPRVLSMDLEKWALQPTVSPIDFNRRDNLIHHNAGLQLALSQRNAEIERLRSIIEGEEDEERARRMREKAYKEGWKACAATLMQATQDAANNLRTVNRAAYAAYMKEEA